MQFLPNSAKQSASQEAVSFTELKYQRGAAIRQSLQQEPLFKFLRTVADSGST
jgi:hypothetical protein